LIDVANAVRFAQNASKEEFASYVARMASMAG
jgi:hypothetical protein